MFTRLSALKSNLNTSKGGQWTPLTPLHSKLSLFSQHPTNITNISTHHTLALSYVQKTPSATSLSLTFKYPSLTCTLYKYKGQGRTYATPSDPSPPAEIVTQRDDEENNNNGPKVEKHVQAWLFFCTLLVFGIIIIGGITRLTESGLSMTDWQFQGSLPPLTEEEWVEEFEKYKQFPEFRRLHSKMNLEEFKSIYFWEYLHRMWGRFIGVAFGVPYLYFAMRGKLKGVNLQCGAILLGIGFQGLLGWWMVKSGLEEPTHEHQIPRVSQYRLAAHLTAALALYSGMLWTCLTVGNKNLRPDRFVANIIPTDVLRRTLRRSRRTSALATSLVFLTAISGAFVAGLDAGLVYNTFPLMGDTLVPEESWQFEQVPLVPTKQYDRTFLLPAPEETKRWLQDNLFENSASVQFNHRALAFTTSSVITYLYLRTMPLSICSPKVVRLARNSVALALVLQVTLGISTLLNYVPTPIAAAHQGGSVLLLSANIWYYHLLKNLRVPKV